MKPLAHHAARSFAALALAVVSAVACAGRIEQSKPALSEIAEGQDADIAKEPEKGPEPIIIDATQQAQLCCEQCAAALVKDKTGDAPDKIPCVDFTADLKEECLVYFRKNAMTAAQATACAAKPPVSAPADGSATNP
ncbi:MAG: hypothetical protein EXR75_11810 [Myxococcales bacterium]|nr:hypothetical protein [Myxococcales bacterium]